MISKKKIIDFLDESGVFIGEKPIFTIKKFHRSAVCHDFCRCCLLIKAKQQHGKNENKNTGLFINCMDFVVVRTKKTK
jgi:hypothetical protein